MRLSNLLTSKLIFISKAITIKFYQRQLEKGGGLQVSSQPAFTCSKLTIEILEQGVKYVQS